MTETLTAAGPSRATPSIRRFGPLSVATLIGAPLVLILGRALNVPHDDQRHEQYLTQILADPGRADAGATLVTAGGVLLIGAMLVLIGRARTRRSRLGLIAGGMVVTGCASIVAIGTVSLVAGQLARHAPLDVAAPVYGHLVLDLAAVDSMTLLGALGFLLFAIALWPSVPRTAAVLIGVGGAATVLTNGGPIRLLVVLTATILFAGCVWVALAPPRATA
jgi:hypothetical protein